MALVDGLNEVRVAIEGRRLEDDLVATLRVAVNNFLLDLQGDLNAHRLRPIYIHHSKRLLHLLSEPQSPIGVDEWGNGPQEAIKRLREHLGEHPIRFDARDRAALKFILDLVEPLIVASPPSILDFWAREIRFQMFKHEWLSRLGAVIEEHEAECEKCRTAKHVRQLCVYGDILLVEWQLNLRGG